jgi:hypothetical protein
MNERIIDMSIPKPSQMALPRARNFQRPSSCSRQIKAAALVILTCAVAVAVKAQRPPSNDSDQCVASSIVDAIRSTAEPLQVQAGKDPVRSCESLASVSLPLSNARISSATLALGNKKLTFACRVDVTVTHPPADDQVKIFIGLPAKNWNGRVIPLVRITAWG